MPNDEAPNTDDVADPQIAALRRMTPQQRLHTGMAIYRFARRLKLAGLRQQYPNLSEPQLKRLLNDAFMYARD